MRKNLLSFALSLTAALGLAACSSDDPVIEGGGDPVKEPDPVVLKESSIKEGDEVDADEVKTISLTYKNSQVGVTFNAKATLNGTEVSVTRNSKKANVVEIKVELQENTEYKLIVPEGTVNSIEDANVTAPELIINFKTYDVEPTLEDAEISTTTMINALGFGWNLGNHFDSYDSGNAAGNYKPNGWWDGANPTKQLYTNLVAAGIKTVRIPVTWGPYEGAAPDYTIDSKFMEEIAQHVQWALDAGMRVVINTHHDEYWQDDIMKAVSNKDLDASLRTRIVKTWEQIATRFKNIDDHLFYETFNEIHDDSWGWASGYNYKPVYALLEEWNQEAVNAIRSVGDTHWIAVPGFCASPTFTINSQYHVITLPTDALNKIMVHLHSYDPYDFTSGHIQQWGHNASQETYNGSTFNHKSDETEIKSLFSNIKKNLLDKGIPCYVGEFGVQKRKKEDDEVYRKYYLEYFCRAAHEYGVPVMLWDNHNPGPSGEIFYFINHNNGTLIKTDYVKRMIKAATSSRESYTLQTVYDRAGNY